MNQTDQIVAELYRQAWEASRHPWNLLLSFTSIYLVVGVAVIAYSAQSGFGAVFPYLLFMLSGPAMVGVFWTLRSHSVSKRWNNIQRQIQVRHGIVVPEEQFEGFFLLKWLSRVTKLIGFQGTYLIMYLVMSVGTLTLGFLLVFEVLDFQKTTASTVSGSAESLGPPSEAAGISDASDLVNLGKLDCSAELMKDYCAAIEDAAKAEPFEITTDLVAITRDGKDRRLAINWNGAAGDSLLLTVTLTGFVYSGNTNGAYDATNGYKVGESMRLTRTAWVTIVPELKDFCQSIAPVPEDVKLRLQQVLGLPPRDNEPSLVELWVNPADLFRPSIDPEISDHEAEILLSQSSQFLTISPAHLTWYNDWLASSYAGDSPFPWTRLGYTYDWGNKNGNVGLSEFVIRQNATVGVESISKPSDYCSAGRQGG